MKENNKLNSDINNFYEEKDEKFSRFFGENIQVFQLKKNNYSLLRQIKLLALKAGDIVVDAGCGYGTLSFKLLEMENCKIYGFNITTKHIEKLKAKIAGNDLSEKFTVIEDDYNQIHTYFNPETIDKIIFIESFNHTDFEKKIILLKKCHEVLKKGGEIFIQDFFFPETSSVVKQWKKKRLRKKIIQNSSYFIEDLLPLIKNAIELGFEIKFLNKLVVTKEHIKEVDAEYKIPEIYSSGKNYHFFQLEPYEIILKKSM